jgi:hypothetical protein
VDSFIIKVLSYNFYPSQGIIFQDLGDRSFSCPRGEVRETLAIPQGITQSLYGLTTLELQILPDCEKA